MTEHDIQNKIRVELSSRGFTVFRANVGKVKTVTGWFDSGLPKGFSDLFAIKNGKAYFIEVKKQGGRASEEQLNFIERMKNQGCVAGVVYSVEDAFKLLGVEI